VGDGAIRCSECDRDVDEFTTIAERWLYYSDGLRRAAAVLPGLC
jgi:hypothetical protein